MDFTPLERLDIIANSLQRAKAFTAGMDRDAFRGDARTRYATVFSLETAAKVAEEVPREVRLRMQYVPWMEFDRIAHAVAVERYHETDPDSVWTLVTEVLPDLLTSVQRAIMLLQMEESHRPNVN
ncbi:MAG: DUF86 domain-containing protein [SAR202 cluster bacterium]|nr:DUF86 domain-containing protein [SAR202 cluster bacterium]